MDYILVIDRFLHILAGITWIGILYYFNFVQVPGLGKAKADGTAAGITKHIAPRALLWFRWSALLLVSRSWPRTANRVRTNMAQIQRLLRHSNLASFAWF